MAATRAGWRALTIDEGWLVGMVDGCELGWVDGSLDGCELG